jgi:hypothetical protein
MVQLKSLVRPWIGSTARAASEFSSPNEAINFDKQVIFIAVPKTGTTSVRNQLRSHGPFLVPNPHLDITQLRSLLYFWSLRKTLGTNAQFPTGDMPSDTQIRAECEETFRSFFKFSAVRNPWARTVSLYFRQEGVISHNRISFEEFCENHAYASDTCSHPTLHCNQLDWLTDEEGRIGVDYVYKIEEFESSLDEIREMTNGRIALQYLVANKNPLSRADRYRDMFTDRTRQLIAKRFEKDVDTFKYAF